MTKCTTKFGSKSFAALLKQLIIPVGGYEFHHKNNGIFSLDNDGFGCDLWPIPNRNYSEFDSLFIMIQNQFGSLFRLMDF